MKNVRVRFAPSPTGYIHVGNLRTVLFNLYFAKKHGGTTVLRIEDTDQERFVEGALEVMLQSFKDLNIEFDEGPHLNQEGSVAIRGEFGPYIQSERLGTYAKYVEKLIENGDAYYCFATKEELEEMRNEQIARGEIPRYDGRYRDFPKEEAEKRIKTGEDFVIRLKVPEDEEIVLHDLVYGEIRFPAGSTEDQILVKSDGFPTYHLAVVVDDHLMKISHIFRGEEWIPSTPKQILLYEAFGWEIPQFAHLPNVVNKEKKKLSKRHGDVFTKDFLGKGYLPEALCNFISLIGWNTKDGTEKMTREEIIDRFEISRVQKGGGFFDIQKLNWMNSLYIKEKSIEELLEISKRYFIEKNLFTEEDLEDQKFSKYVQGVLELEREKISHLSEFPEVVEYFFKNPEIEKELLFKRNGESRTEEILSLATKKLEEIEEFTRKNLDEIFVSIEKELGCKKPDIFMPLRVALTGRSHAPGVFDILLALGKEESLKRLMSAL